VAAAANFAPILQKIGDLFNAKNGHRLLISSGASAVLRTQIQNGAPFDVFFSADQVSVAQILASGQGVKGTESTYARGKLVLWSSQSGFVDASGEILKKGHFKHLAIGNPQLAPYGRAAKEVLANLALWPKVEAQIVMGESISQTFQFILSQNAELGFVAMSQVVDQKPAGSFWIVPEKLYSPLLQDVVLLQHGRTKSGANALLKFLKSEVVQKLLHDSGYESGS